MKKEGSRRRRKRSRSRRRGSCHHLPFKFRKSQAIKTHQSPKLFKRFCRIRIPTLRKSTPYYGRHFSRLRTLCWVDITTWKVYISSDLTQVLGTHTCWERVLHRTPYLPSSGSREAKSWCKPQDNPHLLLVHAFVGCNPESCLTIVCTYQML